VFSSHIDLDAKSLAVVDRARKQQNCGDPARMASRDRSSATFSPPQKKKIRFLRKSFVGTAHGSVHKGRILAQTSFVDGQFLCQLLKKFVI
jgi:hypothetical protein